MCNTCVGAGRRTCHTGLWGHRVLQPPPLGTKARGAPFAPSGARLEISMVPTEDALKEVGFNRTAMLRLSAKLATHPELISLGRRRTLTAHGSRVSLVSPLAM